MNKRDGWTRKDSERILRQINRTGAPHPTLSTGVLVGLYLLFFTLLGLLVWAGWAGMDKGLVK